MGGGCTGRHRMETWMGTLDRETLGGETLDDGIGWRHWMGTLDGRILDRDTGQRWMEMLDGEMLDGTLDRDFAQGCWRHWRGR